MIRYIITMVIAGLIVTFLVYPDSFDIVKANIDGMVSKIVNTAGDYDSIKNISQNPQDYVNKHVIVKGELQQRLGGPSIASGDDYWIWLDDTSCIERQRDYKYGNSYVAEGKIGGEFRPVLGPEYFIVCSSPLR
ncbi:MAG: hypothetical protein HYW24_04645 [Candidatus Aenigmarchaeota archaeon]|nr:hypothetical protein [Candidatus Aenigmarchaeota archaeon]